MKVEIGDFLICRDPANGSDIFRGLVVDEKKQSYTTIVFLHDEENGYMPGETFDMMKVDWRELHRAPCDTTRTHWLTEKSEYGT